MASTSLYCTVRSSVSSASVTPSKSHPLGPISANTKSGASFGGLSFPAGGPAGLDDGRETLPRFDSGLDLLLGRRALAIRLFPQLELCRPNKHGASLNPGEAISGRIDQRALRARTGPEPGGRARGALWRWNEIGGQRNAPSACVSNLRPIRQEMRRGTLLPRGRLQQLVGRRQQCLDRAATTSDLCPDGLRVVLHLGLAPPLVRRVEPLGINADWPAVAFRIHSTEDQEVVAIQVQVQRPHQSQQVAASNY